eukprot:SRR837773.14046.p1 GENE.SRR837773.14046~~SRR837773.14046.p1  ORF type:complete len:590 (+),score=54.22 SRR837773.14046:97-1866(+)
MLLALEGLLVFFLHSSGAGGVAVVPKSQQPLQHPSTPLVALVPRLHDLTASSAAARPGAEDGTTERQVHEDAPGISFLQESESFVPSPTPSASKVDAAQALETVAQPVVLERPRGGLIRREQRQPSRSSGNGVSPGVSDERPSVMGAVSLLMTGASWALGNTSSEEAATATAPFVHSAADDAEAAAAAALAFDESDDAASGDSGGGAEVDSDELVGPSGRRLADRFPVRPGEGERRSTVETAGPVWAGLLVVSLVVLFAYWVSSVLRSRSVKPLQIDAFVVGDGIAMASRATRQPCGGSGAEGAGPRRSLSSWVQSLPVTTTADVDRAALCGFYDNAGSRTLPCSAARLVRLHGVVHGPLDTTPLRAPLSGQECVMYSASASRHTPSGIQGVACARAAGAVNFAVKMQDCERTILVAVAAHEVLLQEMFWGRFSAVRTVDQAPPEWQAFLDEHQVDHLSASGGCSSGGTELGAYQFVEQALLIGTKVNLVGELHRNPSGALSLRPIRGGDLHFIAESGLPAPAASTEHALAESRRDSADKALKTDNVVQVGGRVLISDAPALLQVAIYKGDQGDRQLSTGALLPGSFYI